MVIAARGSEPNGSLWGRRVLLGLAVIAVGGGGACRPQIDCQRAVSRILAVEGLREEAVRIRRGLHANAVHWGDTSKGLEVWTARADSLEARARRLESGMPERQRYAEVCDDIAIELTPQ